MPDASWRNQMSETSAERFAIRQKDIAGGYALLNIVKAESRFDDAIRLLERHFDKISASEGVIDLDRWCTYFAFDTVGLVTFSKAFGFLQHATDIGNSIATSHFLVSYMSFMAHFYRYHDALMSIPIFSWLDLQPMKHVMNTTLQAVKIREESSISGQDMMEHWKTAHQKHPERMTRKDVLATANANVAAGADTVSCMLQAFIYLMLRHPKCLSRLQTELDEAALSGTIASPVAYATAQKLAYFQACVS